MDIPSELPETPQPLLRLIATLNDEIKSYDQKIEQSGEREVYAHAVIAAGHGGRAHHRVGLCVDLETPLLFARSRNVGPYLRLVPKQEDSGDSQLQLGISKAGDKMLRKLLVGSARYISRSTRQTA